jgi:hypothetical protein
VKCVDQLNNLHLNPILLKWKNRFIAQWEMINAILFDQSSGNHWFLLTSSSAQEKMVQVKFKLHQTHFYFFVFVVAWASI